MNVKQAGKKYLNMTERAEAMLNLQFPDFDQRRLWSRHRQQGFSTIPRTLPIIMQAINDASKSQPAGHVLFCLWARSPDHPLLRVENPAVFAAEAGFSGLRMVDTWRRRMKQLVSLGFIKNKPGDLGDFQYVLLLNPNIALVHLHEKGEVQASLYNRFLERLADVGASNEIELYHTLFCESQVKAQA
ncbi:hypothetical protein KIF53_19740 [Chromobacterium subtsugae]|uniref:Uncharacterized protein n=1 Tax=Chromobacterium subtsugae TaxID=251747 RepID=A0ABS7FIH7_9NEIS|nr:MULTISPECIES: hypothetical protein [Chromobacterium]MBW7568523.1 hypothetical protein [Chromobacterium subtsugae]MBW8289875.1 hypothetical protein [Chromobacterium subtsugae]WSE89559.1 hypothetical protein U6115_11740 [Chromobacterium subtsugae]WVH57930.1 hypothetical protein U6151_11760 [Chromobacterium subtsugae]